MIDKSLQEEDRKFQEETKRVRLFAQHSQFRFYLVLAAVTFSPLLSFFLYFNSAKLALDERLSELTTIIVEAAASHVDPYLHSRIVSAPAANDESRELTNDLNALRDRIPEIDHLSTLVVIDDQIFTIVDTNRTGTARNSDQALTESEIRTPYSGKNAEVLRSYLTREENNGTNSIAPFISESAGLIESCAPLVAVRNAYPTLVCVEVSASAHLEQSDRLRNSFLLASLLMFSITAFIVYSVVQHQRQVKLSMSLLRKQRDYFLKSSRTDALTGVMNRRAFQRSYAVAEALFNRNKIPFAVIAIDVDNFKSINDTYGHDVGDHVLVTLVAELSRVIRKSDQLARMGGEEFCVLCTLNEPGQAFIVAEKLRRTIEALKVTIKDNHWIKLTISLGIHPVEPAQSMEDALKAADIALYFAKTSGRNRSALYTKGMEDNVKDGDLGKPSSVGSEKTLDWAD